MRVNNLLELDHAIRLNVGAPNNRGLGKAEFFTQ